MATEIDAGGTVLLQAVMRRFPEHARAIEHLAEHDETFRDICEELVEAEKALESAQSGPEQLRKARGEEWQGLIERLTAQIAEALRNENVIPIGRKAPPRPG